MSNKKYNPKYNNSHSSLFEKYVSNFILSPLIIIISVIPLIVRMKVYNSGLSKFSWFSTEDSQTDFFLYYKSKIFTLVICFMAMIIISQLIKWKQEQPKYNNSILPKDKINFNFIPALIPLTLYGILALLSTLLSKYSSFGFSGIFEQFESIFVLLGYCVVVYYSFIFVKSETDVKLLFKCLLISVIIQCLLGLTQATGNDFFASSIGKRLIVPINAWSKLDQLSFTLEKNRVYLSLYNPNYVGLYTSLIVPIFIVLLIVTKNIKSKICYSIVILGLLLCMIGSSSRNGFVALCVSFLFILILFRNVLIKNWKYTITILGLLLVGIITINTYFNNIFITRLKEIITDRKTIEHPLSSIKTNADNLEITYNNNTLYVQAIPNAESSIDFILKDKNQTSMETTYDNATETYKINDERFSSFSFQLVKFEVSSNDGQTTNIPGFNVIIEGVNWYFSNQTGDGTYYYYNGYGKFTKIMTSKSAVFTNYERVGSGRGFIWSKTIPLLKERILLGSGADTFILVYPQNDYVGRYNNGYITSLITKPHNIYLQIAVQTGVISLIAFLVFYGMYFISCMKLYIKNKFDTYMSQAGAAIFVGTIGYMISGLFNDSTITVSPVFWALIGIGLAVNFRVQLMRFTT